MTNVWANSMACHPRATCHIAGCCHLANSMSWSQSYVSYCRVLPLSEFTVMIPEPHATLQGAVTWRNQCHDRATLQGIIISSAVLKIVFRHILLFLKMQSGLWRAAAFVSSPIHLFMSPLWQPVMFWLWLNVIFVSLFVTFVIVTNVGVE